LNAQLRAVNFEPTDLACVSIRCLTSLIRCMTLEIIYSSSPALDRPGQCVVEARGFEPLTSGLQSPRSAKLSYAPVHKRFCVGWLRGRDLNPRPLGYEPNELPDCSTPRQCYKNVVGLGRFELPTSRLSGVRSNQLSYRPVSLLSAFPAAKKSHTSNKWVRFDGGHS
jgi:hypothetical protein